MRPSTQRLDLLQCVVVRNFGMMPCGYDAQRAIHNACHVTHSAALQRAARHALHHDAALDTPCVTTSPVSLSRCPVLCRSHDAQPLPGSLIDAGVPVADKM